MPRASELDRRTGRTNGRGFSYRLGCGLLAIGVLLPLLAVLPAARVQAAPVVPFAPRFSTNDNGAIALFGNNLMTCPDTNGSCAGARAATNNVNNNSFVMRMLDVDGEPDTFNSSASQVDLPAGSTVLWAGLYWGARLQGDVNANDATTPSNQMLFRIPGGDYQPISSDASFGPTAGDGAYQEFADVTGLVSSAGSGAYWAANVAAARGNDRYAGWSLIVAYRSPDLPLRNLTVFDGFNDVGQGNPQTITISGFRAPATGPVGVQLGMVAYEGDRGTSGDQAQLNATQLSTPTSSGTNSSTAPPTTTGFTSCSAHLPTAACWGSTSSGSVPPASPTMRRRPASP